MHILDWAGFFRRTPDAWHYAFSVAHWVVLASYCLLYFGVVAWLRHRVLDVRSKPFRGASILLNFVLCGVILALYGWYIYSDFDQDYLPLYHCRLAMIILLIDGIYRFLRPSRISRSNFLQQFAVTMGTFGAWLAMILPAPDPYAFPHVTNFTYLLGHWALGILCLCHLRSWERRPRWQDLLTAEGFLLGYNIFLTIFNRLTGENYGYFYELPFFTAWGHRLGLALYPLLALAYAICLAFFWWVNRFLWDWIHGRWGRRPHQSVTSLKRSKRAEGKD